MKICISKSIGLAYSRKKIYASNLQKGGVHVEGLIFGILRYSLLVVATITSSSHYIFLAYICKTFTMPTFKPLLFKRNLVSVLPRMSAARLLLTRPKRGGALSKYPSLLPMTWALGEESLGSFPESYADLTLFTLKVSDGVFRHGSNFWDCEWNPLVLPFKWNLFSSTVTWYNLFSM